MVKTVLGVDHQGLRDWLFQRISALIMALYSICMGWFLFTHPHLTYGEWYGLFTLTGMKIFTLIFIAALLYHAWIGMWTVFTDYIKPASLRLVLEVAMLFMLVACFLWALVILWGVN